MLDRRTLLTSAAAMAGVAALGANQSARADVVVTLASHIEVTRFIDGDTVELLEGRKHQVVKRGERFGDYTLMEILGGETTLAVLENFTARDGRILVVDKSGPRHDLSKTLEATAIDYGRDVLGHSQAEIEAAPGDMLARQILSQPGDPRFDDIATALQPIHSIQGGVYSFVGTPGRPDTVAFAYGGRSSGFDPAVYQPSIAAVIAAGKVWDGLVGGYLPVLRFVYPDDNGDWTELVAFAPFSEDSGPLPVWYRLSRIEGGQRVWSKHIDSRLPNVISEGDDLKRFYADLIGMKVGWDRILAAGMKVDVPDTRMADQARHGVVRLLMGAAADTGTAALQAWGMAPGAIAKAAPATGGRAVLGLPQTDSGEIAGALSAAYGYGLVKGDAIREALLTTYSGMAHLHTRGTWLAPAARKPFADEASAYDRDAQAFCPLMMRWLLAFEDPDAEVLWLGRGMPRAWFENEKIVLIDDIPTRWGRVSFATDSDRKREHRIAARVVFPAGGMAAETKLRLRSHDQAPIRSVMVNGKSWRQFDVASEVIVLPAGMKGEVLINARY